MVIMAYYAGSIYSEFYFPGAEAVALAGAGVFKGSGFPVVFFNPSELVLSNFKFGGYFSQEAYFMVKDVSHVTAGAFVNLHGRFPFATAFCFRRMNYSFATGFEDNENIFGFVGSLKIYRFCFGIKNKIFLSYFDYDSTKGEATGYGLDVGMAYTFKRILLSLSCFNVCSFLKYSDDYLQTFPFMVKVKIELAFAEFLDCIVGACYQDRKLNAAVGLKGKFENFAAFAGFNSNLSAGIGAALKVKALWIKFGFLQYLTQEISRTSLSVGFNL